MTQSTPRTSEHKGKAARESHQTGSEAVDEKASEFDDEQRDAETEGSSETPGDSEDDVTLPPHRRRSFRARLFRYAWRNAAKTMVATQVTIAVLLAAGALYFGSSLLVPITIAVLAYLCLRPVVTKLVCLGVHHVLASGIVILASFTAVLLLGALLFSPLQQWLSTAPASAEKISENLKMLREPFTVVDRVEGKLDEVSEDVDDAETEVEVSVEKPTLVDETVLLNTTGKIFASVLAISVLTFFMLSTGDDLLNRILYVMPDQQRRDEVLNLTSEIQHAIGRYLFQITLINVGLGVCVAVVMWLVGMPTPILWGTMATLFNFIPYVGALAGTGVIFVAAAATFDTITRAALTAFAFWCLTAIEGQFVTPSVLGKTLRVGPVIVLVAIAFWGFFWGLPGVFVAVPLLLVQRQLFARFESTYPLAVILGAEPKVNESVRKRVQEDAPLTAKC